MLCFLVFVTFPFGVLDLVWYLIVLIPGICFNVASDQSVANAGTYMYNIYYLAGNILATEILVCRLPYHITENCN